MAARTCRYHCMKCGCHFTSLAAFDLHLSGPLGARRHFDADALGTRKLREITGAECRVAGPETQYDVTLYEYGQKADEARGFRRGIRARAASKAA